MFLSHFSLNEHPFMEHPPIGWLMRDPRFDEALAGLQFFEQQGSIGLILGQTGIGKSSLLRLFMHDLPQNRYRPLYLHLTPINANAFLRLMVNNLGEKPRIGKDRMLLQILDRINQNEKDTLLIIDEAHLIDPKTLTDLRVLISSIGERVPLKILLCGQEDLRHVLKRSSHADLLHRITLRIFLKPYTKEQTAQYIDNRIAKAGASDKIFEPEAKSLIHDYAAGIPRQINNIATACLLAAISQAIQKINDVLVNNIMAQFQLP
jgi:general secretion pathway protein A